jgi:endo-1,3-1,4-beta-glycanase ExoK
MSLDWSVFHTYVIEWTPDYISWSIDGTEVRRTLATESPGVSFNNKQQHLMMNFWTPTFPGWGDNRDPSTMPWYIEYDFVEAWSYDSNSGSFNMIWRDDFDILDTTRWLVSDNWGFG